MGRPPGPLWLPLALIAALPVGVASAASPLPPTTTDAATDAATAAIGFRKFAVPESAQGRPLEVAVWYPTDARDRDLTLIGDNRAFVGAALRVDAPPQPGRHRLVVISHGYGGNWTNEQWLASDLAAQGYIVAAANHPGTTSRDRAPPNAVRLWERPRDVSRVIDALNADSQLSPALLPQQAAVIGHSLGGWTAMALAGGRFDPARFARSCQAHPDMAACGPEIGADQRDAATTTALAQPLGDQRVRAVVTLDLGLAQGFDPASLAAVTVPTLVIAAGPGNPKMPVALESRTLADRLPAATTRYVAIDDASHFSFLSVCKADAIPLLEADRPGDGVVCRDGNGRDRATIHRQVADQVSRFLKDTMPTP